MAFASGRRFSHCTTLVIALGSAGTAFAQGPAAAAPPPAPVAPKPPAPAPVAPKPPAPAPAPAPAPPSAAIPAAAPAVPPAGPVSTPAPDAVPATQSGLPPLPGPEAAAAAGNPLPPPAPPAAPPPEVMAPPPPPEPKTPWYDALSFGAFVDAYAAADFNFPKGQEGGAWRQNPIRAYDVANGFALAWVGLDLAYEADPVGGTLQLRFGPEAELIGNACVGGRCDSENGLSNVKQAYATWRPGGAISGFALDIGKFDTPYGAEVADSQYNLNYTRGVLYWLGQPIFHTGLRVTADVHRSLLLRFLAVNGWNRTLDNNSGKTFGLQGTFRVPKAADSDEDLVTLSLGYLMGPEQQDFAEVGCPPGQRFDLEGNPDTGCVPSPGSPGDSGLVDRGSANSEGLRHFVDLTAVAAPTPELVLLLNGSYGTENVRSSLDLSEFEGYEWYGVMLGARYAATEQIGVGGRFEYYGDPDGETLRLSGHAIDLVTGTITLDYSPASALTFKLDGRLDWSNKKIFPKSVKPLEENSGTAVSATLGVVVSTN
jgi:hypothetical protein